MNEVNVNIPKKAVVINKYAENGSGWIYCLGLIGSLVYFFQQANTFWEFVLGLIKAIVWPGVLVYHLLKFLGVN